MSTRFEHVYFMPWVGWKYGRKNYFRLNLMVLGESHYRWGRPHGQHETVRCVSSFINLESLKYSIGPKVKQLICGEEEACDDWEFWSSILFYNYVQEYVGNEARVRPTSSMWSAAEPAFWEVVEYYSPDVIVVLGKTLWEKMSQKGKEGPTINDGHKDHETWWFPTKKGKWSLSSYSNHPAAQGFSVNDWHPTVRVLLETAKELKRRKLLFPR